MTDLTDTERREIRRQLLGTFVEELTPRFQKYLDLRIACALREDYSIGDVRWEYAEDEANEIMDLFIEMLDVKPTRHGVLKEARLEDESAANDALDEMGVAW
jgi:hypothetical protein